MLEVDILDEAKEFLKSLPEKHEYQIIRKILFLAQHPHPPTSKQLKGFGHLYRLRSGKYRIVYFIDGDVLKIPLIDTRNDDTIYRRLRNIFT